MPRIALNHSIIPAVPPDLATCRFVYVRAYGSGRPPLSPLHMGPFLVLEQSPSAFKLQLGTRVEVINISHLKPAHTPATAVPAVTPARGQPQTQTTLSPTTPWNSGHLPLSVLPGESNRLSRTAKVYKHISILLPFYECGIPKMALSTEMKRIIRLLTFFLAGLANISSKLSTQFYKGAQMLSQQLKN